MAQMSKWTVLIRTFFASLLALSVVAPNDAVAQSQAEITQAYDAAIQQGTIRALERFIERYPLSPQASAAFREIVLLSRGSVLAGNPPTGINIGAATRSVVAGGPDPY